jgi:hypothetical protein
MNIDCQWISKNLEALFCDGLAPEEDRLARTHIEGCPECKEEVAALIAIDPLIKNYFQRDLSLARRRSAPAFPRRVIGLSAAGVAVTAILFALLPRVPQTTPIVQTPAPIAQTPPVEPAPNKADGATSERAKPSTTVKDQSEVRGDIRPSDSASTLDSKAPAFLVTDPAGYSRTLADYRGYTLLMGVWSSTQPDSAAYLERLYKTFGSNPKLRLIGVTNERQAKPANTTFPVLYNQGSRLLDAKPGEFVLIDESGTIRQRGSLTKNFDYLSQVLRKQ